MARVGAPRKWTVRSATRSPDTTADRAALAYSMLPLRYADEVNLHLSITERQRLREGLARVRDAGDYARIQAVRALGAAVRRGVVFPRPPGHDENDCPFAPLESQPRHLVADVMEQLAPRDALAVVVALCHLSEDVRREVWDALDPETRGFLTPRLAEVPLVRPNRTREYARDMKARLARRSR
jgi:hypothetical protein